MKRIVLRLLLGLGGLVPIACPAQSYVNVEPMSFDPDQGEPGPLAPTLTKKNGKKVTAPAIEEQIGFTSAQISDDHERVGWLVLKKNGCCSWPLALMVFKDDRIERVIDENCIWRWTFRNGGSQIALWHETCHLSRGPEFELFDLTSGPPVATYGFLYSSDPDVDDALPADAPAWVRDVYVTKD